MIVVFDLSGVLGGGAVGLMATAAEEFTSAIPLEAYADPDTLIAKGDPGGTAFYDAAAVAGGQWLSKLTALATAPGR